MATTTRKAPPKKGKAIESKTGAGAAIAERSKDSKKPTFGKAAPKTVKPATPKSAAAKPAKPAAAKAAAKPAKISTAEEPSIATRVMRKVKNTASGAVAMAASVIGKDGGKSKAKSK
jgi:hypothetical protein